MNKNMLTWIKRFFYAALAILLFLYVLNTIQPQLHYNVQQPSFLASSLFFHDFVSFPGGISEYAASFLMQFFYFNWAGASIILIISLGLFILSFIIIQKIYTPTNFFKFLLTGVLLFPVVLFSNYLFPLSALIKLLMVFLFIYVVIQFANPKNWLLLFIPLAVSLYLISGGSGLTIFATSSLLFLNKQPNKRSILYSVVSICWSLLIPYLAYKYFFVISISSAYWDNIPHVPLMLQYKDLILVNSFYFYLPALVLLYILIDHFVEPKTEITQAYETTPVKTKTSQHSNKPSHSKKEAVTNPYKKYYWLSALQASLILIASFFALHVSFDQKKQDEILLDYYASNEQWGKVIDQARKLPDYDFKTNYQLDRALSHLDLFSDKFFTYPHLLGSEGLFPDKATSGEICLPAADLYFDLGYIAESQHWAFEAQTLLPYSPRVLKRIILNAIISKDYAVAEKFLTILGQNFLSKDWVDQYLPLVKDTTLANRDPLIVEKRKNMPTGVIIGNDKEFKLLTLLEKNPTNKMAFEYLEAYYLMNNQLGDFAERIKTLQNFGYRKTPIIFQEGLMLYLLQSNSHDEILRNMKFKKSLLSDFKNFNQILMQNKGNRPAAQAILRNFYKETYWYYALYDNPSITKNKLVAHEIDE
jgi:hypothetical protein